MARCKPNQLAWIRVPAEQQRFGIEQLHNRVVRTKRLMPGEPIDTWAVEPRQFVTWTMTGRDRIGRKVFAGDVAEADGIPDCWLVPFDPRSMPDESVEVVVVPLLEPTS